MVFEKISILRGASHYGREALDFHQSYCKKPKSSASRLFTLCPKSKGCLNSKWTLNGNSNYGRETVGFFFIKKSIIDKILAVRLERLFWTRNKVGYSFFLWSWGLGLRSLHTMDVQVKRPWEQTPPWVTNICYPNKRLGVVRTQKSQNEQQTCLMSQTPC